MKNFMRMINIEMDDIYTEMLFKVTPAGMLEVEVEVELEARQIYQCWPPPPTPPTISPDQAELNQQWFLRFSPGALFKQKCDKSNSGFLSGKEIEHFYDLLTHRQEIDVIYGEYAKTTGFMNGENLVEFLMKEQREKASLVNALKIIESCEPDENGQCFEEGGQHHASTVGNSAISFLFRQFAVLPRIDICNFCCICVPTPTVCVKQIDIVR